MKLILLILFWLMVGYATLHFIGFWGVFAIILILVAYNFVTFDKQLKEYKEKK